MDAAAPPVDPPPRPIKSEDFAMASQIAGRQLNGVAAVRRELAEQQRMSDALEADPSNRLFQEMGPYDLFYGVQLDHITDQLKMAEIVPLPPDDLKRLQRAKARIVRDKERLRKYRSGKLVATVLRKYH
jgi:hypothetical protein